MLVDPKLIDRGGPPNRQSQIVDLIAAVNGRAAGVARLREGVYQIGHFNFDHEMGEPVAPVALLRDDLIRGRDEEIADVPDWFRDRSMSLYGVADDVDQILAAYDFAADPRRMVISVTEIRREDQPPDGGWRWHKWGPYIGKKEPQHEYLFYEKEIESVLVFHIYILTEG